MAQQESGLQSKQTYLETHENVRLPMLYMQPDLALEDLLE